MVAVAGGHPCLTVLSRDGRIERPVVAATANGTRGSLDAARIGPGASSAEYQRPWYVTPVREQAVEEATNSSNRPARSSAARRLAEHGRVPPYAARPDAEGEPPARQVVEGDQSLANGTGCRKLGEATKRAEPDARRSRSRPPPAWGLPRTRGRRRRVRHVEVVVGPRRGRSRAPRLRRHCSATDQRSSGRISTPTRTTGCYGRPRRRHRAGHLVSTPA